MSDFSLDIQKCVNGVTEKWAKQRRAEKRNARAYASREYMHSSRIAFTDVARKIIPEAYRIASGGGTLPASKRQIYYAAREKFLTLCTSQNIPYAKCKEEWEKP